MTTPAYPAYSPVLICNMALAELAAKRITALSDNTLEARECAEHYPLVLAELMQSPSWKFQTKRVALAVTANDRPLEWEFAYTAPADLGFPVRLVTPTDAATESGAYLNRGALALHNSVAHPNEYAFERFGTTIYAGVEAAYLEYVERFVTDMTDATPKFVRAFSLLLAARICMNVTGDKRLRDALLGESEVFVGRASAAEHNAQPAHYGEFYTASLLARWS